MDSRTKRDLLWERKRPFFIRLRSRGFVIVQIFFEAMVNVIFCDKIYEYNHAGRKPKEGEFI